MIWRWDEAGICEETAQRALIFESPVGGQHFCGMLGIVAMPMPWCAQIWTTIHLSAREANGPLFPEVTSCWRLRRLSRRRVPRK